MLVGPMCIEPGMLTKYGAFRFRGLSTQDIYQLLLGPTGRLLNTNTVFLSPPHKFHFSFFPNSYISSFCCNLISRNLLGAILSCPIQRDSHPPLWASPSPPPAACAAQVPRKFPFPTPAPASPSGLPYLCSCSFLPQPWEAPREGSLGVLLKQTADEAGS